MSALKSRIEAYCNENAIAVPTGFGRHPPSRYAVIKKIDDAWKLVATTWITVSDVIHYLDHFCTNTEFRIFDFKKSRELKRRGTQQLEEKGSISNAA